MRKKTKETKEHRAVRLQSAANEWDLYEARLKKSSASRLSNDDRRFQITNWDTIKDTFDLEECPV